jgi:CelD/BcsL family acetyltransferase involved in cellulose biosynthesis
VIAKRRRRVIRERSYPVLTADRRAVGLSATIDRGGVEVVERLAEPWVNLCREGPSDSPFCRPEYIAVYLRTFERKSKVVLASAGDGERLRAVLPLVEERAWFCGFPVRRLRGAANIYSCRFDMAVGSGDSRAATGRIWNALRDEGGWDLIELPDVPSGGAAEQLLELAAEDGFLTGKYETVRTPYIPCLTEQALSPSHKHFRKNLARRKRNAQARWEVRLRRIETDDPVELQRFYDVEKGGWKGSQKSAIACDRATREYHDGIARAAAAHQYFSLYLLEFGGKVAAGHFGLSYAGRYYFPKSAYDETYSAFSPGHLIVEGILEDLLARGFTEFDFLGPWAEWKGEWAPAIRSHSNCYVIRPGLFGRTLYEAKFSAMAGLRRLARRPAVMQLRRKWESR